MYTVSLAHKWTRDLYERQDVGFSLLEMTVAIFICMLSVALLMPVCSHTLRVMHLQSTSEQLVWNLREVQSQAQIHETPNQVEFARFNPYYFLKGDAFHIQMVHFDPGVDYQDGYLQMPASRIAYTPTGSSAAGGTVRLATGTDMGEIQLYMGSGLQVLRDPR